MEKKEKFTPGPWADDRKLPPNSRSVIARTSGGVPISGNTVGPHDPSQDEPNANLIITSPGLYEALDGVLRELSYLIEDGTLGVAVMNNPSVKRAFSALAKARGEK